LQASEDVYTNHIHADDLARACALAAFGRGNRRVINVTDDSDMSMGDYFDLAAGLLGLPCPARVSRREAQTILSPMQWSFLSESRRLSNLRMKQELGLRLRFPTVVEGLQARPSSH
jgi:nucleoside-diphosphate-sugar epimerase